MVTHILWDYVIYLLRKNKSIKNNTIEHVPNMLKTRKLEVLLGLCYGLT